MRMSRALKEIEKLIELDIRALALEISDLLNKHNEGEKLLQNEKIIISLAYSEFIADNHDEKGLFIASEKADLLRKRLNINHLELINLVEGYL